MVFETPMENGLQKVNFGFLLRMLSVIWPTKWAIKIGGKQWVETDVISLCFRQQQKMESLFKR